MVELDKFLAFLALLVGGVLGNFLLNPTFSIQQKVVLVFYMVLYAGLLAYCNSLLERLEEECWKKGILALFGAGERK